MTLGRPGRSWAVTLAAVLLFCLQVASAALKVGFVYLSAPSDLGWSFEHDQGRKYLEYIVGLNVDVEITCVKSAFVGNPAFNIGWPRENVLEDPTSIQVFDSFGQRKFDLVLACSSLYGEFVKVSATRYPETIFVVIADPHRNGSYPRNMNFAYGRIEDSRLITGFLAGLMTKTNQVGYVAAWDDNVHVLRGINAFFIGARYANPNVQLHVIFTSGWLNPPREAGAARKLLDTYPQIDILTQHQDAVAVQKVAKQREVLGIGYHSDIRPFVGENALSSAVWFWGPLYASFAQQLLNGTWWGHGRLTWSGAVVDGVRVVNIAPLSHHVPDAVRKSVIDFADEVFSGHRKVFCGPETKEVLTHVLPLFDSAGCLDPAYVMFDMDLAPGIISEGRFDIDYDGIYVRWNSTAAILLNVLAIFGMLLSAAIILLVSLRLRDSVSLRALTPSFSLLTLVGSLLGYGSIFLFIGIPTDLICTLRIWMPGLSFVMLFAPIVAKNLRIYLIFSRKKLRQIQLTNRQMMIAVVTGLGLEIILNAVWSIGYPFTVKPEEQSGLQDYERLLTCHSAGHPAATVLWFIYKGFILLVTALIAFMTRRVASAFNESRRIAIVSYNLLFCAAVTIPIITLVDAMPETILLVGGLATVFALTVSTLVLFWQPLWVTYFRPEKDLWDPSLRSFTSSQPSENATVTMQ